MELNVLLKDKKILSEINLPNGVYELKIKEKDKSRTYEQIKKVWATISEISIHEYGDTSQKENIYFQLLEMSGIKTEMIIIPLSAVEDFRKKVRTLKVVSNEIVNHKPVALVNICLKGLSEFSKKEACAFIESITRYASELGIESEVESWK